MAEEQSPSPEEMTPAPDAAPASTRKELPFEDMIGWILRVGVFASAVLIALGVALLFVTQQTGYPGSFNDLAQLVQYGPNRLAAFPNNPADVLSGLAQFKPYAFIALGLLLLIATPVIRVAASVVIFVLERDYAYVLITLFVLLILVVSFLLGKAS